MSDCRFGVSPVNYPDPDPEVTNLESAVVVQELEFAINRTL